MLKVDMTNAFTLFQGKLCWINSQHSRVLARHVMVLWSASHFVAFTSLGSHYISNGAQQGDPLVAPFHLFQLLANLPTLLGQRLHTSFWALWRSLTQMFAIPLLSALVVMSLTQLGGRPTGMYQGVSAKAAEQRKHSENDPKCAELGWLCVPLAVENYGAWGPEALRFQGLLI
ncbi:hypothetical protein EMCRGX_G018915 [Ephydatia muelleri]